MNFYLHARRACSRRPIGLPPHTSPSFRCWPEGIEARIPSSNEVPLNYERAVFAVAQGRLSSTAAEQTDLDCLTGLKELAGAFKDKIGNCWWKLSTAEEKKEKEREKALRVVGVKGSRWWGQNLWSGAPIYDFMQVENSCLTFVVDFGKQQSENTWKVNTLATWEFKVGHLRCGQSALIVCV